MLNPGISCTVYGIEMLIVYIFLSRITERKFSVIKCLIIGFCLFELSSATNLIFQNNFYVNFVSSLIIKMAFAIICFAIKPISAFCYSVILEVMNFALEMAAIFSYSAITGVSSEMVTSSLALVVVATFFSKSLLCITCLILSNLVNPDMTDGRFPNQLFFYPVSIAACLFIFWFICTQDGISAHVQYLLSVASAIVFISTLLLFITYQGQIEKSSELVRLKGEFERLQTEKAYYDILEQQNHDLMIYAHDTKKHLSAIQEITTNPDIQGYISKLSDQLKDYSRNCHSGNMMLDVMINKYAIDSKRLNIAFDYNVRTCNLKEVEDIDLVSILGNLMDNAFTAAEVSEERCVSLETTIRNGYSVLIVSNSCDTMPNSQGGKLITSKKDRNIHGFGIKSVSKTLKKYKGDHHWDYEEKTHMFITTVMISHAAIK